MEDSHKDKLTHMLGAGSHYRKKQWGFRNHYVCCKEGKDDIDLKEMEKLGLVVGRTYPGAKNSKIYHATKAGAVAIGFKPYQLRNAELN